MTKTILLGKVWQKLYFYTFGKSMAKTTFLLYNKLCNKLCT